MKCRTSERLRSRLLGWLRVYAVVACTEGKFHTANEVELRGDAVLLRHADGFAWVAQQQASIGSVEGLSISRTHSSVKHERLGCDSAAC